MSNDLVPDPNSQGEGGTRAENLPAGGVASVAGRKVPDMGYVEHVMRTDYQRYLYEGLDKVHLEHLERQTAAADPDALPAFQPMEPAASRAELSDSVDGQQLVEDWDDLGGFSIHLRHTQEAAKAIVSDVADTVRGRKAFMESFDRYVPEAARMAVYRTLAQGAPLHVIPVDDAGIAKFTSHPAGKELVAEWGSDAPRRIATFWQRVNATVEKLFDDDRDGLFDWFETLSPSQAKAIVRRMSQ
jgi:hypothetical protein